jgi:hypothetical protein
MLNTFLSWRRRRWTAEISTERFVVSPVTTGGFAKGDMREVLRHARRQLTAKQRAVIALRYLSADHVTVQHIDRSSRSWLMPALAAAAVVLVAVAGVGLNATRHGSSTSPASSSVPQQAQVTSTAASATGQPAGAPASFNPLVLPLNFGWLPSGFTENLPAPGEFPTSQGPLEVMTTQVSFGASTPGGEGLQVTVAARGVKVNPWIGGPTGSSAELAVIGSAPDINGHPAKWLAGGLEWEYANGGWATILTAATRSSDGNAPSRTGEGRQHPFLDPDTVHVPIRVHEGAAEGLDGGQRGRHLRQGAPDLQRTEPRLCGYPRRSSHGRRR